MPQQSLLPDHPAMAALQITVMTYPNTTVMGDVDVTIGVGLVGGDLKTRHVVTLHGIEADYLDTLVDAATSAFMYEETPAHVVRAVAGVCKLARSHGLTGQF